MGNHCREQHPLEISGDYSCWQFAKRDEAVLPSNGVLLNDVFRLLRRLSGTARREQRSEDQRAWLNGNRYPSQH